MTASPVIGDPAANDSHSTVELHAVTPGAYRTLQIRLLHGRPFDDGDRVGTAPVVIVNQAFAVNILEPNRWRRDSTWIPTPREKAFLKTSTWLASLKTHPKCSESPRSPRSMST